MPTTPRVRLAALLLAALVLFPACDSGGTDDPPPSNDQILFGVNYTRLFAEPTEAMRTQVRADWSARTPTSEGAPKTPGSATIDGATYRVLQHTVSAGGESNVHYGIVRIPDGASNLPVVVVHHGGDDGFSMNATTANTGVLQWVAAFPDLAASTVQIWPVYRSETIETGTTGLGGPYTAEGDPSPWDYDVDDSIAFLDAALDRWDAETDETSIVAMGFSRGANTALLHAIRDTRILAVTDYYGPADFYNEGTQLLATGVLAGSPAALGLPGAQYILDNVLDPLRNEDDSYNADADYDAARLEVLRRSASAFTSDLPDTQVHHHYGDPIVTFVFSQAFSDAVAASGTPSVFDFNAYGAVDAAADPSYHAPEVTPDMQPSLDATEAFLLDALGIGTATRQAALAY